MARGVRGLTGVSGLRGRVPVLALVIASGIWAAVRGGFKDLLVYQHAGQTVLDGVSLYASDDPVTGLPFTYPPFAGLLMVPLAPLPAWLAAALWTGASVAALAAVVALALRALDRPAPGWLVALLTSGALALEPVWQNLTFGQTNLFLMLAALVDLLAPQRRWSGVLVGLVAGVKLAPLVLVVMLALVGRRTAAGRAVLTFAATVVVGFVAMPGAATTYWTDDLLNASRVGPPELAHNQSGYGALTRLLDQPPSTLLWATIAGPVALAILLVGALWWRRGNRLLGTCLGALAMLVASPVSWSHHWVWAVPLAPALWDRSRWAGVAWAAVFVARPILWPPWGEHRELEWGPFEQLAGNAYLLAAAALAIWAAVALRRGGGGENIRMARGGSGDGEHGGPKQGGPGHGNGLARAVVTAGQEGVRGVAAAQAGQVVRQVRVAVLDGVPHGRASFRCL